MRLLIGLLVLFPIASIAEEADPMAVVENVSAPPAVREQAAQAAWALGGDQRSRLIDWGMKASGPPTEWIAPMAWEAFKKGEEVPGLMAFLVHAFDQDDNGHAEGTAASIAGEARRPVCEAAAASKGSMAHAHGTYCLAQLAAGNLDALTTLARHADPLQRLYAARWIQESHPEGGAPVLVELLKDKDESVRVVATGGLGKYGALSEPAVPLLIQILATAKRKDARSEAACALGDIGEVSRPAVPQLIKSLRDKVGNVRACAADALGRLDVVEAVPELLKLLSDESPYVRTALPPALARLAPRSPGAVAELGEALSVPRKAQFAAESIGRIDDRAAVLSLLPALLKSVETNADANMTYYLWQTLDHLEDALPDAVLASMTRCLEHQPGPCSADRASTVAARFGTRARPLLPTLKALQASPPSNTDSMSFLNAIERVENAK